MSDAQIAFEDADLQLMLDFVNTNDLEAGRDQLDTPERLRDWLVSRDLARPDAAADAAAHARAIAIREGIRTLGRAHNDEALDAALVRGLNQGAAQVPMTVAVRPVAGDGEWSLQPAVGGIDGFLGRILAALARSMADGTWSRVKACRNDTCRWLFYDQSRNRSGTWCSMAVCGSRMKARAYRARQRDAASA